MKILLCYLQTLLELNNFISIWLNTRAIYIAHDYIEQKDGSLKCLRCGKESL